MTTYYLCKKLIEKGKLTEIMLDVYYANERITTDQYTELMEALRKNG